MTIGLALTLVVLTRLWEPCKSLLVFDLFADVATMIAKPQPSKSGNHHTTVTGHSSYGPKPQPLAPAHGLDNSEAGPKACDKPYHVAWLSLA